MKSLLMVAVGLSVASSVPLAAGDYTINGRIDGYSGHLLLMRPVSFENADTVAVVPVSDGTFTISGQCDTPAEVILRAADSELSVPLFLEDGAVINVSVPSGQTAATVTGGGELQRCRNRYGEIEREYARRCDSVRADFRANYDMSQPIWQTQLRCALRDEAKRLDALEDEFIARNDNMVSASLIAGRVKALVRDKKLSRKYSLLGENGKASMWGRLLRPMAEEAAKITVGGIAPDFTMQTPDGESISLYGVKAKVKILDFWASWCGPCRAENPNLIKIYKEFHPKGLEILSVSLDNDRQAWRQAIEKDGMIWKHASELGQGSTHSKVYKVYGVPYMLILDGDNRIISEGMRGDDLYRYISFLFE